MDKNKWLVDIQPNGRRGKRIRKYFKTKAEAEHFNHWAYEQARKSPAWTMPRQDNRRLNDLIEEWYEGHGNTLIRALSRYQILRKISKDWNNPFVESITIEKVVELRNFYCINNIKKTTINKYIDYLRIMFNQLIKLKKWTQDNPIKDISPLKTKELEKRYLSTTEIRELLSALESDNNPSVAYIAKICLATGARWSEVESLTMSQIGDDRVTFIKTKAGKNRTVPLDSKICTELKALSDEQLFQKSYAAFRKCLRTCSFTLRENQATHVLRHTFATHFIANGGNILALKEILGHSDIKMTMIYAQYSPEHLEQAKYLNPLTIL